MAFLAAPVAAGLVYGEILLRSFVSVGMDEPVWSAVHPL
jgi:hypothetical protein